ncbi:head assembly chaperone protein [Pectobacterium phage POP12]|nr:head assembly chaperone protein [Pectobacterium phage POP12]
MKNFGVKASGNFVIIHAVAKAAGSEIKTDSGLLVGIREHAEIPVYGTIVSVGELVPTEVSDSLLGSRVVIPSGGTIQHVVNPDVVNGKITAEEAKKLDDKLISCHYTHIQAVYEGNKPE